MEPKKDDTEWTEKEKRDAGEPFDVDKLYQEMDDSGLDAIIEGINGGSQEPGK